MLCQNAYVDSGESTLFVRGHISHMTDMVILNVLCKFIVRPKVPRKYLNVFIFIMVVAYSTITDIHIGPIGQISQSNLWL